MARQKDTAKRKRGRTASRRSGGSTSSDGRVESQRMLTTLMSNLPGMVYRCRNDRDWTLEFISDGVLPLTGYRPDELIGQGAVSYGLQIIHPNDRQPVWDQVQEALARQQPFQLIYRIVTKSGVEKWVWEQGRGIFAPDGVLLALEGFVTDITERKRAEEAIRLIEEGTASTVGQWFFETLVKHLARALQVRYAFISEVEVERPFMVRLLALWTGEGFGENFSYDIRNAPCEHVVGKNLACYPHSVQTLFPNDAHLRQLGIESYLAIPLFDSSNRPLGHLGVMHDKPLPAADLTERVLRIFASRAGAELERTRTEGALAESEQRFRTLVKNSPDVIMRVARDGTILFINYTLPQYTVEEVVGTNVVNYLSKEDGERYLRVVDEVFTTGESRSLEMTAVGPTQWLARVVPLRQDGEIEAVMVIATNITERKQAEKALQESGQFNQQVITNAREGIIVYDRDLRYVVWNPCMEQLTGMKAEQILGKRPRDLPVLFEEEHGRLIMEPETMTRIEASIQRAMTGETFSFLDVPFVVRHTGMKGWTSVRYGPFHNARGEIIGVIATVWEITERKRTEEQLEQSVSLLQATLESTANGLVVVDTQGTVVSYNQRFLEMWQIPESLIKSRDDSTFLENCASQLKDPEGFLAKVKELHAQPEMESVDILEFKNGRVLERHSNPHRIGERVIGRVWSFHDITTLKLVEQSLTKLSSAVEQSAESIFITNRDGVIEYVNPAFEEMQGYAREEAIGQNARLLKSGHHSGRFYESLWETILSGRVFRAIFVNKKKNGDIYYEDKTITPIRDRDGAITHFVSVGRDITERKRSAEARERLAAILEATTDFVGTVDVNGSFLYLNQAGRTMLGLGAKEPAAELQISACHPQWAAAVILNEAIPKAIKQGVWNGESVLLSRDGREIPVSQVILAHKTEDGSVEYLSTIARDISERKAQTAALEYQANHDALTALPNRNLLNDRLRQAILAAQRDHHSLALLVLDLDRFKEINDTLGHHHGDLLLKEVGPRLRAALRESDTVARLGGDEFAVLLPTADQEGAVMTAQKILQTLTTPFMLDELALDVEASIGIELFSERALDAETILRHADVAMYMAKQAGSGYALYDSEHDQYSHRRLALMGELRHAIERRQLFLHYQPTVNLKQGQVIGVEALLRWRHPKYGLVPTDQFIPLAEQTGLIKPLTELVVDAALEQCRAWMREGMPLSVSVNLSARSLHDPTFADQIDKRLLEYGIAPRLLEMEITESAIMSDPDRAMEILSSLSIMGVRLAIDDFGVGHSSLAYLKKLPVHEIKIDKSFVLNMDEDPDDVMIVRSIIDLGHNQGLKVVAEGVQSQQTLDRLIELGCDKAQGYFISRPIPADELTRWVSASPWTIVKV